MEAKSAHTTDVAVGERPAGGTARGQKPPVPPPRRAVGLERRSRQDSQGARGQPG